jgi:aspartate aminotransferase-like enzyme
MTMLFTPGPVKLTDEIRMAQSQEMISHREGRWSNLYSGLAERFRKYANAEESYLVTGSGTLGIEMNILNCVRRNERMVTLSNGEFGKRFAEICRVYCDNVEEHKTEIGKGWNIERAKAIIDNATSAAKGTDAANVFGMVYNETSNGTLNDIRGICLYAKKKGMRTIIDGVSAWPATELDLKAMGIDFFSTGSQKAIASAPGITMLAISREGAEFNEKRADPIPSFYMNMKKYRKFMVEKKQTPFTPAVSLYFALKAAFDHLDGEGGPKGCGQRHAKASEFTQKWAERNGMAVVAEPGFRSYTITALWTERAKDIKKQMREKYDIEIATGMGETKEKMVRICHIGNFTQQELEKVLECVGKLAKQ